ncbi:MAG: HlyD family efflux transporter periplasmic adaptor subunit [Acidobacteria bacterium]|nr:MAG: HlyD family efflux transporter periplasmic adaptor subunit [Acidobacteriota bacterium]
MRLDGATPAAAHASVVLLVGCGRELAAALAERLADAEVAAVSREEARRRMAAGEVDVLCLGEALTGGEAQRFLSQVLDGEEPPATRNVVLAAGQELALFQDLVDDDRLFYLSPRPPPLADVERILRSALSYRRQQRPSMASAVGDDLALGAQQVLELAQQLAAEEDPGRISALVAAAIPELVLAERGACLLYDAANETLWCRPLDGGEERRESAAAGVVSFVLRTAETVVLERVGEDPRYDPEADNDGGRPDERFLAVPVTSASDDAPGPKVLAVVVALRAAGRPPFGDEERRQLEFLAAQLAPILDRLALKARLDELAALRYTYWTRDGRPLFRQEALEEYSRAPGEQGQVLELSPRWTRWAYPLLLVVFLAAVLFACLGSIHEYATGIAVVRDDDATEVTAVRAGTVTGIHVESGQRVDRGQLLVSLYGAQEAAELERLRREVELGLISRLRNPADAGAAQALGALREQQRLAEARLEERSIRAPHGGVVADLRVQLGQPLTPGQVILTLDEEGDDHELSIIALFPGHYRPQIAPGMPLRLELQGHRYAYQHLTVESVGERVVGPAEARRVLGAGIGDAVPVTGPVVFVRARLPSPTFESGGRLYRYHDGILGNAEVRVRSERIIFALLPGLRALFEGGDG